MSVIIALFIVYNGLYPFLSLRRGASTTIGQMKTE